MLNIYLGRPFRTNLGTQAVGVTTMAAHRLVVPRTLSPLWLRRLSIQSHISYTTQWPQLLHEGQQSLRGMSDSSILFHGTKERILMLALQLYQTRQSME